MSRTFLIWQSVLAALQAVAGAGALANLIPEKWASLFAIIVAGAQIGTANYIHGLVTIPASTPIVTAGKDTKVTIEASPESVTTAEAEAAARAEGQHGVHEG